MKISNFFHLTLFLSITFFSTSFYGQKIKEVSVGCFYDKDNPNSIIIYDEVDGKVVDKLKPLSNQFCYYKFTISKSKNGWLKIKNLMVLPGCEKNKLNETPDLYFGKWIKAEGLKINLPDITPDSGIVFNFYKKPNKKSKILFTKNKFASMELIGVENTWAFVRINENGITKEGWLEAKYQCAYPWTTCPVND